MSPAKIEEELIAEFSIIPDAYERFAFVVDRAKGLPPLPDSEKLDAFLVPGCQAQLWVVPSFEEESGTWNFRSESDAPIVHAMAALFCQIYSGHRAEEIRNFEPSFLEKLQLLTNLTPNRRHGMAQIVRHIRAAVDSAP